MLMEVLKNFYLKGYMKETVSDFEHLEKFIQCKLLRLVLLCIVCLQSSDGRWRCANDVGFNSSGRAQKYYLKGYIKQAVSDFEH